MNIPAINGGNPVRKNYLPFSPPDIHNEEIKDVEDVLKSGWITTGEKCRLFEKELSIYTGAENCVLLNSATAGLFLVLKTLEIKKGDEVITTPYTFASTANVIIHTGAKPVFADVEANNLCISPEEIEKKITTKTKAIIPVHFGGHPIKIDEIKNISKKYKIIVLEDAAHAAGAEYKGKKIGNGENFTVFSFHAVKNLTTAEGGAIMTDNKDLSEKIRIYSLHGQTKDAYSKLLDGGWKYDITVPGYKFNMTDIQAAIGINQLKRLDKNIKKRSDIAREYTEFFKNFEFVKTPVDEKYIKHAWHLYPLIIDFSRLKINRDNFILALSKENISSNVHYIPIHIMSYYKKHFKYSPTDFPVAYSIYLNEISLPIYPQMKKKDIHDVKEAFSKLFNYYKK